MSRPILIILIAFAVAFLFSGCSYSCEFVVINETQSPMTVEYHLKAPRAQTSIRNPAKVTTDEFKKDEYHWREIPSNQYQYDDSTATFIISVAPNEVLLLESGFNCVGREDQYFEITFMKIDGAQGTILLNGHQAVTQFKREERFKYVIRYR